MYRLRRAPQARKAEKVLKIELAENRNHSLTGIAGSGGASNESKYL